MPEEIIFRPMQEGDQGTVADMMKALYQALNTPEDYMTDEKIARTFQQLLVQPEDLKIDVFEINQKIVGYALLFKFWYNEFGGMVWNIDELYVHPDFQSKGIVSAYVTQLSKNTASGVALSLEVLPRNKRAYALYKRLGFTEKETVTLYRLLE